MSDRPSRGRGRGPGRGGRGPRAGLPHNKWTAEELQIIHKSLGDQAFMMAFSDSFALGEFPAERAYMVNLTDGGEFRRLCTSIAQRVLEEAGEANSNTLRPVFSIAKKIQDMREHVAGCEDNSSGAELYQRFDLKSYLDDPRVPPRRTDRIRNEDITGAEDYVAPVRDASHITFKTRILNQYLACTLCMGYLQEACTIIECLHTFCKRCIRDHFRTSHLCPTCRKDLGANPADLVRNDRTLQSIVDKVCPAPKEDAPGSDAKAVGHEPLAKRRRTSRPSDELVDIAYSLREDPETKIQLPMDRPYLRTSGKMPVALVRKYILCKAPPDIAQTPNLVVQVLCHEQMLRPEWTIAHVYEEYWNNPLQDMVLTYRLEVKEHKTSAIAHPPAAEDDMRETAPMPAL